MFETLTLTDKNGVEYIVVPILSEPVLENGYYMVDKFSIVNGFSIDGALKKTTFQSITFAGTDGVDMVWDGVSEGNRNYFRMSRGSASSRVSKIAGTTASDQQMIIARIVNGQITYIKDIWKRDYDNENVKAFNVDVWEADSTDYANGYYFSNLENAVFSTYSDNVSFVDAPYRISENSTFTIPGLKLVVDGAENVLDPAQMASFSSDGLIAWNIKKAETDEVTLDITSEGCVLTIGKLTSSSIVLQVKVLNTLYNETVIRTSVENVSDILLEPVLQYISKGNNIQFSLKAFFADSSSEDVTSRATWGLSRNTIDEPVQELDGFTIDATGLLTAVDPTVSSIVVSAKYGGLGQYTTVFVSDYSGIYFPGGTTGAGGGSTGGGGGFGKNEVSDSIDIPSGSVAGDASATGMFTRYLVNSSYLDILGDWLWTTDLGLQIAKTIISSIYGNPAESVISLMSYPFDIKTLSGVTSKTQNLFWGNHDSGLAFIALTSQSATVDWGTITLEEYWGNFLDYEPHTKIELYLPWGTGFVSIDPNMCLPGTLRVVTNIDLCKGSCVHNVIGNNNVVIGTYAGQCSQQVPIMSNDYASKMAGVVVSATALAVAGAAGGAASSAGIAAANSPHTTATAYSLEQTAGMSPHSARVMAQRDAIQSAEAPYRSTQRTAAKVAAGSSVAAFKRSGIISRNGSFTDGSAALGVQYPYIILSRPSQSVPEQYGSHYGYPSNIYTRLGTIKGYTEVGEIHLNGISGTDAEISELDSILKGGVIF